MSGNIDIIKNAAEIINSELMSKGYIKKPLLFNSINWDQIFDSQLDNLNVTDKIFENDKNTINIIHSLTETMNRSRVTQKLANESIYKKDKKIDHLQRENELLQRKYDNQNHILQQLKITNESLNSQINDLKLVNKLQSQDSSRLKNVIQDCKSKYKVEIKKRDLQIEKLNQILLDKKKLSTVDTFAINNSYIENNLPVIDNKLPDSTITLNNQQKISNIISQESQQFIEELTAIIKTTSQQNYKYIKFIEILQDYFNKFSNHLKKNDISQLNPSNSLILPDFDDQDFIDEIVLFENVVTPLIANIYQLYHNINSFINQNNQNHNSDELDDVKHQLKLMTERWKEALKTAEDWKNYKLNAS